MAKSRSALRGTRRRRNPRASVALPWGIAGAVLLVVVLVAGQRLLEPRSPGRGPRDYEWLDGVTGTSYDAGGTEYTYPNPAGLPEGRQWLPALGSDEAPVVIVEYSDVFCGHCRDYNINSLSGILEDYVADGEVRYVEHFFGFGRSLQEGAVQALFCAAEQGRYFEYKHELFKSLEVRNWDMNRAARLAGLDTKALDACIEEERYLPALQEMLFEDNDGVEATPTFFINGEKISGNRPDAIREAVEAALLGE